LMFTYLFGGALAGSPHRYLQFILPGTLVMAVLLVTMYAGTGLATDRANGITDRFRALPIWRLAPITGALLGDIARYLLAAALVAVNPVSHLVTAERTLMAGDPAAGPITWVLLTSIVLAAVFAPVTAWLYGRRR